LKKHATFRNALLDSCSLCIATQNQPASAHLTCRVLPPASRHRHSRLSTRSNIQT
jgi:hypothetical protein